MRHEDTGQYLGREVNVVTISDLFEGLSPGGLAHAEILLWLSTPRDISLFRSHLRELVSASPLALFVAGPLSPAAFAELLQNLGGDQPPEQIMTRSSEGSLVESIEEFLQGVWPSEDRFDSWTAYVIAAGSSSTCRSIRKLLTRWIDTTPESRSF